MVEQGDAVVASLFASPEVVSVRAALQFDSLGSPLGGCLDAWIVVFSGHTPFALSNG